LAALLGLLGTPSNVGVEQPSLAHFSLDSSRASGGAAPRNAGAGPAAPLLWGLTIVFLLGLVAWAAVVRTRGRSSRLWELASVPLLVLAGVMTAAAADATWSPPRPASTAVASVTTTAVNHSVPATNEDRSAGSILFDRMANFEAQVAGTEAQIMSASTGQGTAARRQEVRLATLLEATLQQEYAFIATTAGDPAQAAALLQASTTRSAKVRDAVSYDVQAVQAQLAQQAAINQAAETSAARNAGAPVAAAAANGAPPQLAWPLNGVITQGFGASPLAFEPSVTLGGVTYPHFHTGLDISSALGTPVQAAADGVVALAGAQTDGQGHLVGYGNYVVIAHGGNMITLYGHLEQLLVRVGQAVHTGDPIGLEGSTGNSTGPHCHFEVRIGGTVTDPTTYLAPRSV
jgi:murein DD-endopeptidase MepM/ murein hydrolase activator NlpD